MEQRPTMEPSPPDSNEGLNRSPSGSSILSQPLPPGQQPLDGEAQSQQGGSGPNGIRPAVPAACVACRMKHLKCDGAKPCSRCNTHGIECSYVRSRRGYKGPRRTSKQAPASSVVDYSCPINTIEYPVQLLGPNSQLIVTGANGLNSGMPGLQANSQSLTLSGFANGHSPVDQGQYSAAELRERCLEAFFHYFHPAHPFLLPKAFLLERLRTNALPHVEAAIRYVGSYFVKSAPTALLEQEVRVALSQNHTRDPFAVQAMLLFAIALDGNNDQKGALEFLVLAQDLALELGMNLRNFPIINGENIPVLEESWRRTWWELYIVDGMIAGVHQQSSFRFNTIPITTLLPCEEAEYMSGRIPAPHSIEEFDDEAFADEDVRFSSFAYRIAAIRNLGRILQLQQIVFQDDPIIDKTDAYLVNWSLHLPTSKKLAIDGEGQVDEMLFQAQMITSASTVLLHRPHSQLDTSVVRNVTSCAPFRQVPSGQVYNIHAAKIIQAAESISKLITLPIPLVKHTHFFTCVITLASIVHLSCWAALLPLSQDENLKQQIRLNTGALKTISEVWPSASRVGFQVKGVAQEVLASRKAAAEEGFWSTFTDEEMMRSMIEDEDIIEGI